jgi:protein-tyrosine phosphatase
MERIFWLLPGRLAGREGPAIAPWALPRLREAGVQAILSLADDQCDPVEISAAGFAHLSLPLPPQEPADLPTERACLARLPRAFEFLDAQVCGGRAVLVHCAGGKDRTGMVMAYYLVRTQRLDAEAAIAQVRAVRPTALSAPGWEAMALRVIRALARAELGPARRSVGARFGPSPG